MDTISIRIETRWPMKQIAECTAVIEIPVGPDRPPVIDRTFCEEMRLSDSEAEAAMIAALKAIAVLS